MQPRVNCFPALRMYWFDRERVQTVGYHVTPYMQQILRSGFLYPPSKSKVETLGSPHTSTISFSASKSDAESLTKSLAIYALLCKDLMTAEDLKLWIVSNYDTRYKDLPNMEEREARVVQILQDRNLGITRQDLYDGSWVDPYFEYHKRQLSSRTSLREVWTIDRVFWDLGSIIDFLNPVILSRDWVDDLPNTSQGVLESIGVLKVPLSAKTLVDPSLGYSCSSGYYGETNVKGAQLLGLNWKALWDAAGRVDAHTSKTQITSTYWLILDTLNGLQTNTARLWSDMPMAAFDQIGRELPYDRGLLPEEPHIKLARYIPSKYCKDVLLYFCIENEFAIFSEGIPIGSANVLSLSSSL